MLGNLGCFFFSEGHSNVLQYCFEVQGAHLSSLFLVLPLELASQLVQIGTIPELLKRGLHHSLSDLLEVAVVDLFCEVGVIIDSQILARGSYESHVLLLLIKVHIAFVFLDSSSLV